MSPVARWRRALAALGDATRPDLRLTGIPIVSLLTYGVVSWAVGAGPLAVLLAALAGGSVVADGLFWHPPFEE